MTFEDRLRAEQQERERARREALSERDRIRAELVDGAPTSHAQDRLNAFTASAVAELRDQRTPFTFTRSYTLNQPVRERERSLFSKERYGWWVGNGLVLLADSPLLHRVELPNPPVPEPVAGTLRRLPANQAEFDVVGACLWLVDEDFLLIYLDVGRDWTGWSFTEGLEHRVVHMILG